MHGVKKVRSRLRGVKPSCNVFHQYYELDLRLDRAALAELLSSSWSWMIGLQLDLELCDGLAICWHEICGKDCGLIGARTTRNYMSGLAKQGRL